MSLAQRAQGHSVGWAGIDMEDLAWVEWGRVMGEMDLGEGWGFAWSVDYVVVGCWSERVGYGVDAGWVRACVTRL